MRIKQNRGLKPQTSIALFLWFRKWVCLHKALCLQVSHDTAIKVLGRAVVSSEASSGESLTSSSHNKLNCWDSVTTGCWAKKLNFPWLWVRGLPNFLVIHHFPYGSS